MAEQLIHLDPAVILADDNIRFGIRKAQVEKLADDILQYGGVHTPGEVEELPEPDASGHTHRLTVGHIRHAAVSHLNATVQAGLTLPVLVRPQTDATSRLKRQLSENVERESLSPMDMAVSIRKLLDASVPRLEIRKIFSRPTGKGGAFQPASNAWVNIVAGFLDLPKKMQDKIASGQIGIGGAYELGRVSPEKRDAVLERAEKARLDDLEMEEADEDRYLKAEKRQQDEQAKADAVVADAAKAKQEAEQAAALVLEKQEAVKAAMPKAFDKLSKAEQEVAAQKQGQALAELKQAETVATKAAAAAERLVGKTKAISAQAGSAAKRLAAARAKAKVAAAKKAPKAVGAADVQKAAKAEGAQAAHVKLNRTEIMAALKDIGLPSYPSVMGVCDILAECFDGVLTSGQARKALAVLLKEKNLPVEKGKK